MLAADLTFFSFFFFQVLFREFHLSFNIAKNIIDKKSFGLINNDIDNSLWSQIKYCRLFVVGFNCGKIKCSRLKYSHHQRDLDILK